MRPDRLAALREELKYMKAGDLFEVLADVNRDDALDAMYPVDGPHSHEQTGAAARSISRLVRFLNYATQSAHGTPYPRSVDDIVASLHAALVGLDQTVSQSAGVLSRFAGDPRLYQDGMAAELADEAPAAIAGHAAIQLNRSRHMLAEVAETISSAHQLTARLGLRTTGDDQ